MASTVRVRFSPSPTGMFHVGSARTALWNYLFARQHGGVFMLRIEDTDESRNHPDWVVGIQTALRWLELDWDEGPLFQSDRAGRYTEVAADLFARGLAYYCDCSPEARDARAKARGGPPGYDGYCRDRGLPPGEGRALRFRTPDEGATVIEDLVRGRVETPNAAIDDFVIVRGNGGAVFHLAVTVDDQDMAITHVLRAEEHLSNAPKAMLLWEAFGHRSPPEFAHLPLIVNERRQKLSKRRDKVALEDYREAGFVMEAMRNYLCLLGWAPSGDREILSLQEMIAEFRLSDVNKSSAFFDQKKLTSFNERYLREMSTAEFVSACAPFLDKVPWRPEDFDAAVFSRVAPLVQERVRTLAEVPGMIDFLFLAEPSIDEDSWNKAIGRVETSAAILTEAGALYADAPWAAAALHDLTAAIGERHGLALAKAQAPIRVAVTGRTVGPPLFESLELLGRERVRARIGHALDRLGAR